MNPFALAAAFKAAKQKQLQRRCGFCGHVQIVAKAQLAETVPCNKCGKEIPPPKPQAR